jgi:hypothetical protein
MSSRCRRLNAPPPAKRGLSIARFGPGVTAPVAVLLERLSALEPLLEQLGRKLSDIDDT